MEFAIERVPQFEIEDERVVMTRSNETVYFSWMPSFRRLLGEEELEGDAMAFELESRSSIGSRWHR